MTFYEWAQHIPGIVSLDDGFLHIKSKWLSKTDLCDLIALMSRYDLPMAQLKQFANKKNAHWFKSNEQYWYKAIFEASDGDEVGPSIGNSCQPLSDR